MTDDVWEENKEKYCMVHDSVLPKAWDYYGKYGLYLLSENDVQTRITTEQLLSSIARLEPEIRELYGSKLAEDEQ